MRWIQVAIAVVIIHTSTARADISGLFDAVSAAKMLVEYLGIIESLDSKVDSLLDIDLKTAVSLFEQAKRNPEKAGEFMRDARIHFTRAEAAHSGSSDESRKCKRVTALLGLWACCKAAGDEPNAEDALIKIVSTSTFPSPGLVASYEFTTRLKWGFLNNFVTPTTAKLRKYSASYDALLDLVDQTERRLFKMQQASTRPSFQGKWKDELSGSVYEFFPNNKYRLTTPLGTGEGNYKESSPSVLVFEYMGVFDKGTETYTMRNYGRVILRREEGAYEFWRVYRKID